MQFKRSMLPARESPYRYLFLDVNAFFASVEQQEHPELRGKPVGVVPMIADGTVLIAASYEAKRRGCNTLTRVGDARRICPEIILVEGNHKSYAEYHDRVIAAVESVVPVEKVCSIDEMRVRLLESEATEEAARAIAMKVKGAIAEQIGECLTCSIGLAPNAFLSKVASDMQKPNGLTLLHPETMAEQMARLDLIDFCGLNKRMVVRLNLKGIYSAADLLSASEAQMRSAFGSVVGARWWYLLRGYDLPEEDRPRKSLSNSHVLPPELRTRDLAYGVLLRLLQKATARLRRENLSCRKASFFVRGRSGKWEHKLRAEPTHETLFLVERLQEAWHACEVEDPYQVGLALGDLVRTEERTPSMFDKDNDRHRLAQAVDGLNAKFGKNSILPAGALRSKDAAEERIAFQKTSLFDEGKPS